MERIQIEGKRFRVIVKPNSKKDSIVGYDEQKKAWRIDIAAPPDKNKANLELVKFLSKKLGKVRIVSGFTSREKVVEII